MCLCLDDIKEQNHCLFEEYRDPCRAGPGKEKPWVIGEGNYKSSDCNAYTRQMSAVYWEFHLFPS